MHPLETYLRDLRDIRSTGAAVKETSYYPPLANLLNAVGATLKPRVRCLINLKNQGAGMPDGGLFTADQFPRGADEPVAGQTPSRGAIECKGPKDDAWLTATAEQVTRYWDRYRQILVTNYRDFVLVGQDQVTARPVILETFRLAPNEKAFWQAAAQPAALVMAQSDRFVEYLKRVMLHAAPLADPKDVAWFLASYARDAKARMAAAELPALTAVRTALEEALGLKFEGAKGEHFFRSTLVQTLFYGVFSAWVLWHRTHRRPGERFDWETASRYLHVPILRKLFRELADPVQLQEWRLDEVLEWTATVLNRVDRAAFFAKFQDAEAVQYFYEPFLEAFDPELRKQLGVWYTPPEIVRYMVARVDTVLRQDLDRPDGLADNDVYILDPCCGTGAYLVEVLRTIATTLKDKGEDALLGGKLKAAATGRIFGFEILPAPFVVAHLQLGLFLQSEGVPLEEARRERAGVYLTNALTGWEPPKEPKQRLLFAEMEEERDKAEAVKQRTPILVVLGNPPYNGFAGVAVAEERDLSDAYRWKAGDPDDLKPQGQGLNDLYVRFFRMAERCIVERVPHHGVVCFISNHSWLDALSFPLMRQRFLQEFDAAWIDCLNGDKYRTGKVTPDGQPDPSVFSTEHNREGIQVGTAIALFVRRAGHAGLATVRFRDLWGQMKRADLIASLGKFSTRLYERLRPERPLGLPFRPLGTDQGYLTWPLLSELFPGWFTGVKTSRDEVVVDIDRERLIERMMQYFDPNLSHEEMRTIAPRALTDAAGFEAIPTREILMQRGFLAQNIVRFAYRPFDLQWLYWEPLTKLLDRKRPEYFPHVFEGNLWLAAAQQNRKDYDPPCVFRRLASIHIIERSANVFPLLFSEWPETEGLFQKEGKSARQIGDYYANLSDAAMTYLAERGGVRAAPILFHHTIAVLHAPAYAVENAGALRQDWPRVPLPSERGRLVASAELGQQVAALLDTEASVAGVTAGHVRPELKALGVAARIGGGQLNAAAGELDVTVRWGIAGKGGVTMPGKGRVLERAYTAAERATILQGGTAVGLDEATAIGCLGETTYDVYVNDVAFWRNVPSRVWGYTLGGYQVMKKWLSYREKTLLGRGLTLEEMTEVTHMARRIAALLLLQPALDRNYQAVKAATYPWPPPGVRGRAPGTAPAVDLDT
jgi:hypothetical protein